MGQNESVEDMEWVTSYLERLSNALIDHSASDELRAAFAIVARGVSTALLPASTEVLNTHVDTSAASEEVTTEVQPVEAMTKNSSTQKDETDLNSWVYLVRLHDDRRGGRVKLFVLPYSQEIDDYLKKPRRRKLRGAMGKDIMEFCNRGMRRHNHIVEWEVGVNLDTSNRLFGSQEEDIFLGKLSAASAFFIPIIAGNRYDEAEGTVYLKRHKRRYSVAQILDYRVDDVTKSDEGPHHNEFFIEPLDGNRGIRDNRGSRHRSYLGSSHEPYDDHAVESMHADDLSYSAHSDGVPLYTPLPGERWGTNLPVPLPGVGNTSVHSSS